MAKFHNEEDTKTNKTAKKDLNEMILIGPTNLKSAAKYKTQLPETISRGNIRF